MERSKIPLHKWLFSMYLLVTARKGISSLQLAKRNRITQKSAWFVLGRLRKRAAVLIARSTNCAVPSKSMNASSAAEANKHEHKKLKSGRGSVGKVAVLGMRERGGRTHAMVIPDTTISTIQNEIHGAVEPGTQLYTDEHGRTPTWTACSFARNGQPRGWRVCSWFGPYQRHRERLGGPEAWPAWCLPSRQPEAPGAIR